MSAWHACSRVLQQTCRLTASCACSELVAEGEQVDTLYAGKGETARALTMTNFRAGRCWTLIATDLLGRGVDFVDVNTVGSSAPAGAEKLEEGCACAAGPDGLGLARGHAGQLASPAAATAARLPIGRLQSLTQVINYDLPGDTTQHTHRIGRTGRAGRSGGLPARRQQPGCLNEGHWCLYNNNLPAASFLLFRGASQVKQCRSACATASSQSQAVLDRCGLISCCAGEAISFVTEKDQPQLRRLANLLRQAGCEVRMCWRWAECAPGSRHVPV